MQRKSTPCEALRKPLLCPVPRPARLDRGGQSAPRREFAAHHAPHRARCRHDVGQDAVHRILVEDAQIAVFQQIMLERFQLQAAVPRLVLDDDRAVIRQAGFRADRRVLRIARRDGVAGKLVRPRFDLGQPRASLRRARAVRCSLASAPGAARMLHSTHTRNWRLRPAETARLSSIEQEHRRKVRTLLCPRCRSGRCRRSRRRSWTRLRHQRDRPAPVALPFVRAAFFRLVGGLCLPGIRALPALRQSRSAASFKRPRGRMVRLAGPAVTDAGVSLRALPE